MNAPMLEPNGDLPSTGSIDRSIGGLLIGIGVILFFLLTLMGIGRVEQITSDVTHPHHQVATPPASEIVGVSVEQ